MTQARGIPYRGHMRTTITKPWKATVHAVTGLPVAVVTGSLVHTTGVIALVMAASIVGAPAARETVFAVSRACTILQRSRFAALMGEELTLPPARHKAASWRGFWYHAAAGYVTGIVGGAIIIALWSLAVVSALFPVFQSPGTFVFGQDLSTPVTWTIFYTISVFLVVAAIVSALMLARLDLKAAQVMLQLSRTEELEQRVEVLTESRAEVVDAADAERRRIERDLHDGAQQRLVSLAMNLGMARESLSDVDDRAREVIAAAHDEAKQALTELRQLVRGLHPAVLDHRGLDAALSGIAARSPVPAHLSVDVTKRPSPTVEAIAYFVVSEALTNVAKHASAKAVDITVRRVGDVLYLTIRDDGVGGADPARGSGLRGLSQRVSSVDGTLRVSSPAGGPTVITVELPCES